MSRPLGSTATPASSGFSATTGRSASERRNWYSVPPVSASARSLSRPRGLRPRSPYRRSPSHVPCKSRRPGSRRLYAGHHLARNAGTRQAHPEGQTRTPGFDAISMSFDASTAHARPGISPSRTLLERLPGPHLTRSSRAFSLDAHHDSLQLTQHPGRFDACPRRADAGGPTILHLSHSTAYMKGLLHDSSFSVRDTRCGSSVLE